MSKPYGLIRPDKSKKQQAPVKNVFGDSSSDDDAPKKKPCTLGISVTQKNLVKKLQEEALAVDPNIFQYDEVYDEIENKRKEEKLAKKTSAATGPKYIKKLLVTAEKRKLENERRVERQVQKEREAEGEEFKDKESFVTSAYRKKLEEMKEAEEAEKREAYLENIGDVTKQADMSGFYRHIYEQKMEGGIGKEGEKTVKNYRKRKSSADDTKGESDKEETSEISKNTIKAHLPCNLDADSDFEIDSSDSEAEAKLKKPDEIKQEEHSLADIHLPDENGKVDEKPEVPPEVKVEELPEVPKIDIWKKRTVGEAFDEAVQRYYHRKAQRGAAA